MTVGNLQEILKDYDPSEELYLWHGNWPVENYSTYISIERDSSVTDCHNKTIHNPLVLRSYSRQ